MSYINEIREEIREYARHLAYFLDDGATEITAAPWSDYCFDWKNCNSIRGPMLIFKKFVKNKKIKVEVWKYYSHTENDGVEESEIDNANLSTLKKIFVFYFKK